MRMLITLPHIGRLSSTFHNKCICTCGDARFLVPQQLQKYNLSKPKEMRSAFFAEEKENVVITSKAFTDLKTNQTTQWQRQCCLFYKDLWHTYPHPQTEPTPLSITQHKDLHIVLSDMHAHSLGEGARACYMLDDGRRYPPSWQEI